MDKELKQLLASVEAVSKRLDAIELSLGGRGLEFGPVVDPAPDGPWGGFPGWPPFPWPNRFPWQRFSDFQQVGGIRRDWFSDPPPDELGKLGRLQIESRLDDIRNHIGKLQRLEKLYDGALNKLG